MMCIGTGRWRGDGVTLVETGKSFRTRYVEASGLSPVYLGQVAHTQNCLQFQCCGYFSSYDRPFVDTTCANYQFASTHHPRSLHERSFVHYIRLMARQGQLPGIPSFEPTTFVPQTPNPANDGSSLDIPAAPPARPGCLNSWKSFAGKWLTIIYAFCFSMIPLSLLEFIVSVLATNHVYD